MFDTTKLLSKTLIKNKKKCKKKCFNQVSMAETESDAAKYSTIFLNSCQL